MSDAEEKASKKRLRKSKFSIFRKVELDFPVDGKICFGRTVLIAYLHLPKA
jgi:hypothetical protein